MPFSTSQVAKFARVHQQTVIKWARDGIVRPSMRRKLGARQYTERDLIATLIAKEALERRIAPESVKEMVAAVQEGDERDSEIIVLDGRVPGMVINAWIREPASAKAKAELARWERDGHPVVFRKRLRDIVETLRQQIAD